MSKPILLTVDDDPEVLNAIERDLRQHFRTDYRIVKASSGAQALETVTELKQRGSQLALFLVDERMPHMTGTQFLSEAIKIYPDARKVLLTAYADTETAIRAINQIGLDHYLMKPWEPPSTRLYPVLEDLLSEWHASARTTLDEDIQVVGSSLSQASFEVKDFLASNHVPYRWRDIDDEATMRDLLSGASGGAARLPLVYLPNVKDPLVQPSLRELAEKVGLQTRAKQPFYDLIIIGGGMAGLAGAVYGASEGLRTIVVEREAPGGPAGTSSRIENYLGFPAGISGAELAERAEIQARKFGARLEVSAEATAIEPRDGGYAVTFGDGEGDHIQARSVVIAAGVRYRRLPIERLEEFEGVSIYYAATIAEANMCAGDPVVVVGGGNSAGQATLFLSEYVPLIHLVVREPELSVGMSRYLADRVERTPNVRIHTSTEARRLLGSKALDAVVVENNATGEYDTLEARSMFIFIGAAPHTDWLGGLVELDDGGYIRTGRDVAVAGNGARPGREPLLLESSQPGVFAVGDVRSGSVKRVATAVGEGSMAVRLVHEHLAGREYPERAALRRAQVERAAPQPAEPTTANA